VMDILRHGAEVEVLAPPSLRDKVRDVHEKSMQIYRPADATAPRAAT